MSHSRLLVAAGALLFLTAAPPARGQHMRKYNIDSEHSAVLFKVKNRGITYIFGRFKMVTGSIRIDRPKTPTQLFIDAAVNTRSLDTNSKKRDRHLKGKEFFNVTTYKAITFKTKEAKLLEKNKLELTGELTMLGKTIPLTVVYEQTGQKQLANKHRVGGQCTFTVKRSDFGMDAMIPGIADEVEVMVSLEAEVTAPPMG